MNVTLPGVCARSTPKVLGLENKEREEYKFRNKMITKSSDKKK